MEDDSIHLKSMEISLEKLYGPLLVLLGFNIQTK